MNNISSLHIISFSIPYPPDYGGVIDVFYKIKALKDAGIKIILHAFEYGGRKRSEELEKICKTVYYYPRNSFLDAYFSKTPYIVQSRKSNQLLINLQKDNFPILFEGVHTTGYLDSSALKERFKIVRIHNLEDEYYRHLGKREKNIFKKYYYTSEAVKIKFYQKKIVFSDHILCLSKNDKIKLMDAIDGMSPDKISVSPAFHPFSEIISKEGRGAYALFHGDLSVNENQKAVYFLIKDVFNDLDFPLIIAGKNPTHKLISFVGKSSFAMTQTGASVEEAHPFVRTQTMAGATSTEKFKLIPNPDKAQMQSLIQNAHINILPAFQETGIKLKLIYSLYAGRFCTVNKTMLYGTGLDKLCMVFQTTSELKEIINKTSGLDFKKETIEERRQVLLKKYSNEENIKVLVKLIS